jgi:predicted transposase YbfD/YdcC
MSLLSLTKHFEHIEDHRQATKVTYPLFDVLFLTVVAVIGGSEGWEDIEDFGHCHLKLLKKYGDFSKGIPVHDTIARIISKVDPEALQQAFISWMQATERLTQGQVIAIDGKTLRGSYNRADRQSAIHMVNAFSVANGVVMGQLKTDAKSNEITAIPELLALLDIQGALVTIDAMGTQADIAHTIIDKGADFLLAVKGNQSTLHQLVKDTFLTQVDDVENLTQIEAQRGRKEYREYQAIAAPKEFIDAKWPTIQTLGKVISYRIDKGVETLHTRYYISSAILSAEKLAYAVRGHWTVENQLHWVLDVTMNEDACQISRGDGAENLARLRQATVNILKQEPSKLSLRRKRRRAAMDSAYLEKLINA